MRMASLHLARSRYMKALLRTLVGLNLWHKWSPLTVTLVVVLVLVLNRKPSTTTRTGSSTKNFLSNVAGWNFQHLLLRSEDNKHIVPFHLWKALNDSVVSNILHEPRN